VVRADILDRAALRERMLEAFEGHGVTILVASDGPPPRLDADAIDRTFIARDRLGYQPQQRLVWSAEIACEIRPPAVACGAAARPAGSEASARVCAARRAAQAACRPLAFTAFHRSRRLFRCSAAARSAVPPPSDPLFRRRLIRCSAAA
jgi:hypothetical protein